MSALFSLECKSGHLLFYVVFLKIILKIRVFLNTIFDTGHFE